MLVSYWFSKCSLINSKKSFAEKLSIPYAPKLMYIFILFFSSTHICIIWNLLCLWISSFVRLNVYVQVIRWKCGFVMWLLLRALSSSAHTVPLDHLHKWVYLVAIRTIIPASHSQTQAQARARGMYVNEWKKFIFSMAVIIEVSQIVVNHVITSISSF